MKSVTLKICSTVEATRDQAILEKSGIRSVVIPHFVAPTFYVGDNQISELLVREDQLEKAREQLNLPAVEPD